METAGIKQYRRKLLNHYNIANNHYLSTKRDITNETYLTLILCGIRQHKITNVSEYTYNVLMNEYLTQEFSGEWFSASGANSKKRKRQHKARLHMLMSLHYLQKSYVLDPYAFNSHILRGYQFIVTTSNGSSDNGTDLSDKFKLVANVMKELNAITRQQAGSKKVNVKNIYGAKYRYYGLGYSTEHAYTLDAELNIHAHMDMLIDCEIDIATFNRKAKEWLVSKGYNANDISVIIRPIYADYYRKSNPVAIDLSKPLKAQKRSFGAMYQVMNYTRKQVGLPPLYKRQRDMHGTKGMLQLDILKSLSLQQQINVVSCSIQSIMGRGLRLRNDCGLFSKAKAKTLKKSYKEQVKKWIDTKIEKIIAQSKNKQPIIELDRKENITQLIFEFEIDVMKEYEPPP